MQTLMMPLSTSRRLASCMKSIMLVPMSDRQNTTTSTLAEGRGT